MKVQRPDLLEAVSLDLYLMRRAALAVEAVPDVSSYTGERWVGRRGAGRPTQASGRRKGFLSVSRDWEAGC